MNQQTFTPPVRPPLPDVTDRHKTTLAELERMAADYRHMETTLAESRREIDKRDNKIDLLEEALREARENEAVYRRKLIRLATAMESMSRLAVDADKIMRDVADLDEAAKEVAARTAIEAAMKGE